MIPNSMTTPNTPVAPVGPPAPLAPPVDPARFRDLLAYIKPQPEEVRWQSIPWQTDLWEARRLAEAVGKPIFMWAMNGNPLGCV